MLRRFWWCIAIGAFLTGPAISFAQEADTYQSVKSLEETRKRRQQTVSRLWWQRMLPATPSKVEPEQPATGTVAKAEPKPRAMDTAQVLATEQENYIRRVAVCDRLKIIAHDTNDESLRIQAELLEQKAWIVLQSKVVPGRGVRPESTSSTTTETVASKKEPGGEASVRSINNGTPSDSLRKE